MMENDNSLERGMNIATLKRIQRPYQLSWFMSHVIERIIKKTKSKDKITQRNDKMDNESSEDLAFETH